MISIPSAFSPSYAQARVKFLEAAATASTAIRSFKHPLPGRDGEQLAMDVALDGDPAGERLLIVSSACHGVEGYCGSGLQIALLGDAGFRAQVRAAGVAVLYLHALNPYGFSWWRRATQENVDLNRNFLDFSRPLPRNPGYEELAHALVPRQWPPSPQDEAVLQDYAQRHGPGGLQQAVSGGQYSHPEGLFYGGQNPTWSHQALRHVLQDHATRCERLAWIDLHTGLGPCGVGERIAALRDDAAALARARQWWGPNVTSIFDGSSSAAQLQGLMWNAAYEEAPQAEYTGIALEYGTVPLAQTIQALRAEHWLEDHPEVDPASEQARAIKQALRDAFYIDTDDWRRAILAQGREVALQAVQGLSA